MIPINVQAFKTGEIPSAEEGIRRQIVTFGTYAGLTYEQVLENDPEHCQWHSENLRDDDGPGAAFASWLARGDRIEKKRKQLEDADEETPADEKRARIVNFGKFRGQDKTYGEVLDSHPAYCKVLLEKQDNKPVHKDVRRFLTFIKQSGADLDAMVRAKRLRQRPVGVQTSSDDEGGRVSVPAP